MDQKNRLKIFYTDDDAEDKDLFTEIVSEINPDASVELQSDGAELLKTLDNTEPPPDLLFLDINMPVKDGFQVLTALKKDHKKRNIPVVMLSTSDSDEAIVKARSLGAALYVCKPNSYGKFKGILKTIFSHDWRQENNPGAFTDFVRYC